MSGTLTLRLLSLQEKKGAVIKCARKEFEGQEMVYLPRWERSVTGDPFGWVLKIHENEDKPKRWTGGDCYACY